jgi:hypothetical protein
VSSAGVFGSVIVPASESCSVHPELIRAVQIGVLKIAPPVSEIVAVTWLFGSTNEQTGGSLAPSDDDVDGSSLHKLPPLAAAVIKSWHSGSTCRSADANVTWASLPER